LFVAVAVGDRFSNDSFIHVWESIDGLSFTSTDEITTNTAAQAHNVGISGTPQCHIDLDLDNFIAYAYGPPPLPNEPECWPTYLNPITINNFVSECEGDFEPDGDVDDQDLTVFVDDFGRTDCTSGPPCEGDLDGDGDCDGSDLATFEVDFGRTDCTGIY